MKKQTAKKPKMIAMDEHRVRLLLMGLEANALRVVTQANSTVLGHKCKKLWEQLRWDEPFGMKVYADRGPDPFGSAGYEYLHVPAKHPDERERKDNMFVYRVRPRFAVGDTFSVRVPKSLQQPTTSTITVEITSVRVDPLHVEGRQDRWDATPDGKRHPWKTNLWVWILMFRAIADFEKEAGK